MSAQPAIVPAGTPAAQPAQGQLFVSTALDTWFTERADVFARDIQIDDIIYRRLDPEYYAWLRSRMMLAKAAASAGLIGLDAFDESRHRFNSIHQWALDHFGAATLIAAIRSVSVRDYDPPAAELEPQRRNILRAWADRNVVVVSPEAIEAVDEIRDRALTMGWTEESLYQTRGALRFPLGNDYGVICFIKPGDRIGEVTAYSIEIILPNSIRQRFYNRNVDQPWLRRNEAEKI